MALWPLGRYICTAGNSVSSLITPDLSIHPSLLSSMAINIHAESIGIQTPRDKAVGMFNFEAVGGRFDSLFMPHRGCRTLPTAKLPKSTIRIHYDYEDKERRFERLMGEISFMIFVKLEGLFG